MRGEARRGEERRGEEKEGSRGIGLVKLAQHLRDDGGPFLGEADLVHGPPVASIVATSALVSVDQALVEQRLGRFSTAALHTILVEVALRGDDW